MKSMKNLAGQSSSWFKNSWKLWHVFVVSFASDDEDEAPTTSASKQTTKCHIFSRIFRWRKALPSKLFQRFHVTKCYSEIKDEELFLKTFPLNFFGKLTYLGGTILGMKVCTTSWYLAQTKKIFIAKTIKFQSYLKICRGVMKENSSKIFFDPAENRNFDFPNRSLCSKTFTNCILTQILPFLLNFCTFTVIVLSSAVMAKCIKWF